MTALISMAPARPVAGPIVADALSALDRDGYCIINDALPRSIVAALAADLDADFADTHLSQGPFYGDRTKRFHGLLARSTLMDQFVRHSEILEIVEALLGGACDTIQLNLTQAIEILPGGEPQPPHRDQDMWPVRKEGIEYLVNVMWPFTPYTQDNGGTLLWPGSHRRQDEIVINADEAVVAEMEPGSVLLFLGSTLHAGGANATPLARRGMIISYALGWLKPYELSWLAYPPEVARAFPPGLAELAGYKVHRPNLGTHEGRCPSGLLDDRALATTGAVDVLRPEQEALIEQYRSGAFGPVAGVK